DNIIKIIDIKYKIISNHKDISYHDLYQCVTYAKKLNCNDITLVYPKVEIDFLDAIKIDEININFAFVDSFDTKEGILEHLPNIITKPANNKTEETTGSWNTLYAELLSFISFYC
ncbi:MAG: hypothetical protein K6C94_03450, partial [Candidatus Gastranaerophilales bacterium]|nr:hypothetical protein [Candidatus Gastranaerophilales bacterium]